MTYKGTMKGGVIVLDPAAEPLPEGATVEVTVQRTAMNQPDSADNDKTLYDILKDVIGKATGLPEDASYQHVHYLYGTPKRP